jgi:23S rRNA (guanine1835-N2)-methyltransferase
MSSTDNQYNQLVLQRFPKTKDKTLRAWNAADEYLLEHLQQIGFKTDSNILIINDQFGAITCSLSGSNVTVWTDSFLSKTAIVNNLQQNALCVDAVQFVNQTTQKLASSIKFDIVLIKIPKHNSLLEFQLATISAYLNPSTKIVAAGMSKDIHKSTLKLFELILGTTTTSLAKKKARLVFTQFDNKKRVDTDTLITQYQLESPKVVVTGLPGVFSRDSLDIGSRVLLNYLPETKPQQRLVDLGCGTGVLGTAAARYNTELVTLFCDESWLATESAKQTFLANFDKRNISDKNAIEQAEFITADCLAGLNNNSFDHILCNPPFHQQNVQTLSIANQMFKQSAEKLKPTGELRVVANRHLKYRPMLNSYFELVEIISNDPKFVVWLAKKPKH